MMKRVFAFLLLLVVLLSFSSCVSNREPDVDPIYDNASLFSDAEEVFLTSQIQELYKKTYKVSILIVTTTDYNSTPEDVLAKIGYSSRDRVIAFIMYVSPGFKSESEIFTYHTGMALSDSHLETIGDDTYLDVNNKHYYQAANQYLADIDIYYRSETSQIFMVVFWAAIVGIVVAGIFILLINNRYKKKVRSDIYPFDQFTKLKLTTERDIFLNRSVTRVRIQSSSSGGSGGHSGGGRSSGRR